MGWLARLELAKTAPQAVVLPLHHSHHQITLLSYLISPKLTNQSLYDNNTQTQTWEKEKEMEISSKLLEKLSAEDLLAIATNGENFLLLVTEEIKSLVNTGRQFQRLTMTLEEAEKPDMPEINEDGEFVRSKPAPKMRSEAQAKKASKKRTMSEKAKKAIAASQKRRWAKWRKENEKRKRGK